MPQIVRDHHLLIRLLAQGILYMRRPGLLLAFVLCGCETVVDITIPSDYQSKIVVEGEFTPDSLWTIRIGKSVPLNEPSVNNDPLFVIDAVAVVSPGGSAGDTLQHIEQGLYRTTRSLYPLAGQRYDLVVNAPGLPTVETSSWAPPLESELVNVRPHAAQDTTSMGQVSVHLRLKDTPEKNYYEITLDQVVLVCEHITRFGNSHTIINDTPGNTTQYQKIEFESAAPFLRGATDAVDNPFSPPGNGIFYGYALFGDALLDDSLQDIVININPWAFEAIEPLFMMTVTILSVELFAYERSLLLHDAYLLGSHLFASAPVEVYSNIQNGLGIFAGYTRDTYWFDAEGEPWEEDAIGVGQETPQPCNSLQSSFAKLTSSFSEQP